MTASVILLFGIMAFGLFGLFMLLTHTPKHIYKVHYIKTGLCRSEHCAFIKARDIADIQRQLEKRHYPWVIDIVSVEE